MSTEIIVRGTFKSSHPAERATVQASIGYSGPALEPAYRRVASDLEVVKAAVENLANGDDAAVTWWAAEQLRTWSVRPWDKDGKQLPLVHHAAVSLEVKFRDFAALSAWVGEQIANVEGFHVAHIEWALTGERGDALIRQARAQAVHDARERAQLYAEALGLGDVAPVAIADAGMLVSHFRYDDDSGLTVLRSGMSAAERGVAAELVPREIEVNSSVDARFVAQAPS
ncbi:SIMPL domain-containing protein [Mycolicibacterium elephantis]|uniref:SIMPL domain-containing protein n=1 Tax=Mycolicibacterium elephantis TaxID=81858 RepID=UPI0007EBB0DB|nr:SIMPL domain-containing protein [Mycolicibacterium elephantis]OBA83101.1 hypothetical protein A5633_14785 [Mycolicibacterium elephantis]